MKHIAIFTWHNNGDCNCGQTLQAYALQKKINMLDCDTLIIDYKYLGRSLYNNIILYGVHRIYYGLKSHTFIRMYRFDRFVKKNMNISKRLYSYKEICKYLRKNNIRNYLVGSDQVWNNQAGVIPKAMMLDFTDGIKCSYSPSMCPEKDFDKYKNDLLHVAKTINEYRHVGVREESAKRMLKRAGITKEIKVVLDPVFLFSNDDWVKLLRIRNRKESYVLVYCVGIVTENIKEAVSKIKNVKDTYVIASGTKNVVPKNWKMIVNVDPKKFIELIANADYIVTDSYHMIAFSVIFRKQFSAFSCVRNDFEPNKDRIVELLGSIGLLSRLDNVQSIEKKIEYNEETIKARVDESKKYLSEIISDYC